MICKKEEVKEEESIKQELNDREQFKNRELWNWITSLKRIAYMKNTNMPSVKFQTLI